MKMREVFRAIAKIGTGYLSGPQYRVRIEETDEDDTNKVTATLGMDDFLAKALANEFLYNGHDRDLIIRHMKSAGYDDEKLYPASDRYMSVLSHRGGGGGMKRKTRRRRGGL